MPGAARRAMPGIGSGPRFRHLPFVAPSGTDGSQPCGDPDPAEIDDRIDRASARPFGRRFHLRGRERAMAELRGPQTMRAHAAEIIGERLAPAVPRNDGRQTPYRNHPVFVAQHATEGGRHGKAKRPPESIVSWWASCRAVLLR